MAVTLPPLPYARGALAPHISEQTLDFHYGKHHQAYVDNLNKLIEGTKRDKASLEEIIEDVAGKSDKQAIFNNAAQIWNHTFYWESMKPNGGGAPSGDIAAAIDASFGGYDAFKEAFAQAGAAQFGSGWAWLVLRKNKLEIRKTPNAELPWTEKGVVALLTMDVWEHAYYLDYQNKRAAYITTFLDKLVNWDFANRNLNAA